MSSWRIREIEEKLENWREICTTVQKEKDMT